MSCVQAVKTSSQNLFQNVGWKRYCKAAVLNLDIAIWLYEQDICGLCAVPSVFRKPQLLRIELLHVKQSYKPSKIYLTGGVLVYHFNKTDFAASKPDLLSMLGNRLAISKLIKIAFSGKKILLFHYIKQMVTFLNSRWHTFW